jgi:hypothetical protein
VGQKAEGRDGQVTRQRVDANRFRESPAARKAVIRRPDSEQPRPGNTKTRRVGGPVSPASGEENCVAAVILPETAVMLGNPALARTNRAVAASFAET